LKKDIQIPEVSGVQVAVVFEYNDIYNTDDWNVYLINEKEIALEMVVVVSKGFNDTKETAVMRKKIDVLAANSFAKIEWIQPDLFQLKNQFQVTFFADNILFDKTFIFPENTIKEGALRMISSIKKKGVLAR
tara:strand:+ start:10971 stop:11366 length:396 start_codon:yes stop_codon:yes gene_type:complete